MGGDGLEGRIIGPYALIAEIGRGGMGVVYKAQDRMLQREVAIKVLSPHLAGRPEFVARFLREARAAAQLSHPNIAQIYATGEADGLPYIAMEYVKGKTLAYWIRSLGRIDASRVMRIAHEVARALTSAHDAGIVHRDIKPANIMVDDSGRVKVMDFGLAKLQGSTSGITAAGSILGTPHYMAPEQIRGGQIDARTDLYALGATLYELLAGEPPFRSETPIGLMYQILEEPFPDLAVLEPVPPSSLMRMIAGMTFKKAEDRFPSARAALAALHSGDPVANETPSRSSGSLAPKPVAAPAIAAVQGESMGVLVRVRLSVMMFLQFLVWGLVLFSGMDRTALQTAGTTQAWAAVVSPLLIGILADRLIPAERALALTNIVAALFLLGTSVWGSPYPSYDLQLGFMLCCMPALALMNAIVFRQVKRPEDFPLIRLFGVVGWMAALGIVSVAGEIQGLYGEISRHAPKADPSALSLQLAAIISFYLAINSFFLPATPPTIRGNRLPFRGEIGLHTISPVQLSSFAVFMAGSLLACILVREMSVFLHASGQYASSSAGMYHLIAEVISMVALPFALRRLGVKWTFVTALAAWTLGFLLVRSGAQDRPLSMLYAACLLDGLSCSFFFITAAVYLARATPAGNHATAQGFLVFLTLGLGAFASGAAGKFLDPALVAAPSGNITGPNPQIVCLLMAGMALALSAGFAMVFREQEHL